MEKTSRFEDLINTDRAVTFGKFDGVHLGHRKLMEKIAEKKAQGLKPTVFTFDKAPGSFINNDGQKFKSLLTRLEREDILKNIGIETLFEYEVNYENMSLPAEKFVTDIIADKLKARFIAVGEDFHFGYKRKGDVKLLTDMSEECGYEIEVVRKERLEDKVISSSRIRELLLKGDIVAVNRLLGYTYSACGEIVKGNQLGRTWNVPTINVPWKQEKLEARFGVYYSKVIIEDRQYFGMTNFGKKPTIAGEYLPGTETYLYNCNEDLYGKNAKIYFLHFRRGEEKFDSIDSLKEALYRDIKAGKEFFNINFPVSS